MEYVESIKWVYVKSIEWEYVCVDCGNHVESKKTLEALKILIYPRPRSRVPHEREKMIFEA